MIKREHEFRNINGKMCTVGLPLPIELAALQAKHTIKPNTPIEERARINRIVFAGTHSLRTNA